MRFLSLSDRKEAALVCRAWYEASLDPILQRDVIVHFYTLSASHTSKAIPSLSKRRLPHLILNEFDTSLDAKSVVLKSSDHLASDLKSLSLRGSNITESIFVEFLSHCKSLQSLDLSCCNSLFMSGNLLEKNSDLQKVRDALANVTEVNLSSIRHLSDVTFNRVVTVCVNVEKLAIASTPLTFRSDMYYPRHSNVANSSVFSFRNFLNFISFQSCLTSLNLSRTQIGDENIEEIASIPDLSLHELYLVACRNISDNGIAHICKSQKELVTFDLRECVDLTNTTVMLISKHLGQMKNLYISKLRQITDKAAASLEQLTALDILDISECSQISSAGLIKGLCPSTTSFLTYLNLNCCSQVTDSFVEKATKSLPLLNHLDLGSCFPITDKSVHAIARNLTGLRFLRLAWCKNITDLGLLGLHSSNPNLYDHDEDGECRCNRKYPSTVIFKKPSLKKKDKMESENDYDVGAPLNNLALLKHLDVTACKKLSDTGLSQVVRFPELRVLHLGMLPDLTDTGIIAIASNNPSIEELDLSQNGAVTDEAIEIVTKRLRRLQNLNLFGCDKITDKSIQMIVKNCPRLKHIDVSFCNGVSETEMDTLENNLKMLLTVKKRMIGGC